MTGRSAKDRQRVLSPAVADLTSLKSLSIRDSRITDYGLKYLASMQELEYLNISGQITDQGLPHLAKLKSLRGLTLNSRAVTQEALAAMQAKLPLLQSIRTP